MKTKLTFLLLSLTCFYTAFADTFIVTSNADSGPGTLREAITLANANGTAAIDNIEFNIPEAIFNFRIINLVTELPSVSSNIIIDGTTQPGSFYGPTDAKICLKKNDYSPSFSMIKIENASNVKIYGLFLFYGYWQGLFGNPFRSYQLYGINLINSNNIVIGAPGKGNVITGVVHCIYSNSDSCRNISIQSNYLGEAKYYNNPSDDVDPVVLVSECCITFANVKDIKIGGSQLNEGNVFGTRQRAINIDSKYITGNGLLRIQNNLFGRFYDKTTLINNIYDFWDFYITIGRSRNNPLDWTKEHLMDYRVELLDNNIPSHARISNVSDSVIIMRNRFEEDFRVNGLSVKLAVSRSSKGGVIGGEDANNANSFIKKNPNYHFNSVAVYNCGPITILKNIFDCNTVYGSTTDVGNDLNVIPFIQVDVTTNTSVEGRATPNTRVDLYYDDACTACEGKIYIDKVMADASGKWKYTGAITGTVVATATSAVGYTGKFSNPTFNTSNKILQQPTCGKNNGSITGITTEGAETYFWVNLRNKDTVSRSLDLINAGPGEYLLYGVHGGTCISTISQSIGLGDITPVIRTNSVSIIHPSCGLFNGSILGLDAYNVQFSIYKWIDKLGQTVGTNFSVNSLGPGTYRFVVLDTTARSGCSDTVSFVLTNQSGPSLNTNNIQIIPSTCNNNNGSIKGITGVNVTGTPFIRWLDSLNNPVGSNYDLLNMLPGKYRLKFKDNTGCDTIVTSFYIIPNNGTVIIDTTGKKITASKCSGVSGSIQNIRVSGADSYQWINTTSNAIVGTSVDVFNLPSGNYQLTAKSNVYGCTKTSPVIFIPQAVFIPINVTASVTANATCSQGNGSITISSFSNNAANYTFNWIDNSGQTAGNTISLLNLSAGNYQLFAKDSNGCEKMIFNSLITVSPPPTINYTQVKIKNDQCNSHIAGISSLQVNGLAGPTVYSWYDQNNNLVGNKIDLQNAGAGIYILNITDAVTCLVQSNPFTITNTDIALAVPVYDNIVIPRYSDVTLINKIPATGNYILSSNASGLQVLLQSVNGDFKLTNILSDTTLYIQRISGSCSSAIAQVNIKVVDNSYFAIPNAFTPNGDNRNDVLAVKVIGYVELMQFRIYNRFGEKVFETRKLNDGWDGKYKGVLQNVDAYIWVAEGKDIKGNPITGRGTFILIR